MSMTVIVSVLEVLNTKALSWKIHPSTICWNTDTLKSSDFRHVLCLSMPTNVYPRLVVLEQMTIHLVVSSLEVTASDPTVALQEGIYLSVILSPFTPTLNCHGLMKHQSKHSSRTCIILHVRIKILVVNSANTYTLYTRWLHEMISVLPCLHLFGVGSTVWSTRHVVCCVFLMWE